MRDRRSGSRSRHRLSPDTGDSDAEPAGAALQESGLAPAHLIRSVRENMALFLVIAGLVLGATGLLLLQTQPQYSARAVIRMAGERRTLTRGVENAPQSVERPVDPLLSSVQVLTSRTLVGAVVDSLGMRLRPASPFILGAPMIGRRFPRRALQNVTVAHGAPADTIALQFTQEGVLVRSRGVIVSAAHRPRDSEGERRQ